MRYLYSLLLYLLVPFVVLRLLWRSLRAPGYRRRWRERFGFVPHPTEKNVVWVHAVSVGEVQAASDVGANHDIRPACASRFHVWLA